MYTDLRSCSMPSLDCPLHVYWPQKLLYAHSGLPPPCILTSEAALCPAWIAPSMYTDLRNFSMPSLDCPLHVYWPQKLLYAQPGLPPPCILSIWWPSQFQQRRYCPLKPLLPCKDEYEYRVIKQPKTLLHDRYTKFENALHKLNICWKWNNYSKPLHHGLIQMVEEPTWGPNTLDLILPNNPSRFPRTVLIPGLTDHDAVFAEVGLQVATNKQKPRHIPLYRTANLIPWDSNSAKHATDWETWQSLDEMLRSCGQFSKRTSTKA